MECLLFLAFFSLLLPPTCCWARMFFNSCFTFCVLTFYGRFPFLKFLVPLNVTHMWLVVAPPAALEWSLFPLGTASSYFACSFEHIWAEAHSQASSLNLGTWLSWVGECSRARLLDPLMAVALGFGCGEEVTRDASPRSPSNTTLAERATTHLHRLLVELFPPLSSIPPLFPFTFSEA